MYRSKFIFGMPEIDIEIIKHFDLETLYIWIIESPYIEKITMVILPDILEKYSEYDENIKQFLFSEVVWPLTEINTLSFAKNLFLAGKYKLVKIIIDYFTIRDWSKSDYDAPQDADFYKRLLDYLYHYLIRNRKFDLFIKLAPKNVRWDFWDEFMKHLITDFNTDYVISILTDISNIAKELKLDGLMRVIKPYC